MVITKTITFYKIIFKKKLFKYAFKNSDTYLYVFVIGGLSLQSVITFGQSSLAYYCFNVSKIFGETSLLTICGNL